MNKPTKRSGLIHAEQVKLFEDEASAAPMLMNAEEVESREGEVEAQPR